MEIEKATRILAVDIGGTKIASSIVELGQGTPRINGYKEIPTEAHLGGGAVLARVIDVCRDAIADAEDIIGIGISSAGVIDPYSGNVTFANDLMPGWGGTQLASEVEAATGLPCRVLNDVHAHALGEARWGAGRGCKSCLVVAVGTGIGGAFVEEGRIMLGAHGIAGHIGHVCCPSAAGIPCSCGAVGHLEAVGSGTGIASEYLIRCGNPTTKSGDAIDGAAIDRLARAGDSAAKAAEAQAGRALGEVLGSMCNMLDPECIILSGSVTQCGPDWSDALFSSFAENAMPPVAGIPMLQAELGGNAPLIGAAENFLHSAYGDGS